MNQHQETNGVSFSEKISTIFSKYRKAFLILLIAGIGTILVFAMVSAINTSRENAATKLFDNIEVAFTEYQNKNQDPSSTETADSIIKDIDTLVKKYPHSLAAYQGLMLKGDYYASRNNYQQALEAYLKIKELASKHYISAIATQNAAAMYEELSDNGKALALLVELEANFPKDGFISKNRLLFNLGRLYEQQQDWSKAAEYYTRLIAAGTNDDWGKLAQSRIIALKAEKKVQ